MTYTGNVIGKVTQEGDRYRFHLELSEDPTTVIECLTAPGSQITVPVQGSTVTIETEASPAVLVGMSGFHIVVAIRAA